MRLRATLDAVDDPYDLNEAAWRARFIRRRAEERGWDRARARAAALAAAAERAADQLAAATPPPSTSKHAARWRFVPAAQRHAYMATLRRIRWTRDATPEARRAATAAAAAARTLLWRTVPLAERRAVGRALVAARAAHRHARAAALARLCDELANAVCSHQSAGGGYYRVRASRG